ncbi:MAG: N-acetylmuramic acid 6-phosphate etherase [Bryobacteraceae bacterium]|nr:N-acetylmuramic acid 6-phosphate etherase [Bryobacteraceae bacterium]MDW8378568.1 N-acetylmuramic acid 6-phosphate etherase [Bryobacterales bacterium]
MLDHLLTEQRNPLTQQIDRLPTLEMLRLINREDQTVAVAVAQVLPAVAEAVERTASALRAGGRLFYLGAGTSGRLGVLDAAECPPTYGCPPDLVQAVLAGGPAALAKASEASEDDPQTGVRDLLAAGFRHGDVLCGIAASGRTPYVLGAITEAQQMRCLTIGISCVPASALSELVSIAITPLTGPEVITGSTRMKAGTATKLVLNMLSTGVMIRLGYTFGNLMVNVQPKNSKLLDRAQRIVMEAGGVNRHQAAELLEQAGRNVRVAIVMARLGVSRAEAEQRLAACGNVLARLIPPDDSTTSDTGGNR